MRYPSFRRLASLLALPLALGLYAGSALRAQDRAAAGTPPRHWWDVSAAAPAPPRAQPGPAPNAAPTAAGTNTYRLQRDQRGEAKPLILDADEIATWTEKVGSTEYCVFLFRGLAFVQLGIVQARFEQGVAWIDLGRAKLTGKIRTEIYAEGKVRIDDGSAIHDYPHAVFDLTTRGEFKVNAHRSRLLRQSFTDDPLVQRGRAEGLGPKSTQAQRPIPSPVQQTSFQRESELILPPTVQPAKSQPSAPASLNLQPTPPLPKPALGTPQQPSSAAPPPVAEQRIARYGPPGDPLRGDNVSAGQSGTGVITVVPPEQASPTPAQTTSLPGDGPQPPFPQAPATGARAPDGSLPPSGPMQVPPGTPPIPPPSRPIPPPPGKPVRSTLNFQVLPRQGRFFPGKSAKGPNGETIYILTGGVILQVRNAQKIGTIDMEADRIVIWTHEGVESLAENIERPSGHSSNDLEVYLSGHVIIRQAPLVDLKGSERTISADEVYYDVSRNVAVALNGRLQLKQPLMNDPLIATAKEIRQTSINTFEIVNSETFSSRLPSDPGLKVYMQDGVIEDNVIPLRNIFGMPVFDRATGQPVMLRQTEVDGNNSFFQLEKIPFFWLPYVATTAQQPLGPVQTIIPGGFSKLFGFQFGATLNVYQILGLQPRPQTSWLLNLDYMSYRGPGAGTVYSTAANDFFGIPAKYTDTIRAYGMYDRGFDILGGLRPMNNFRPATTRGWWLQRIDSEEMPYGFNVMGQLSPVSDRNFIEQYYKRPWDLDPNFDTFLYVKQQNNNWAWYAEADPRLRNWVTTTQNLPRADGWLIGQDFFHFITYSTQLNAQYSQLTLSSDNLPQVSVTDQNVSTFRGSWLQEAEIPFSLGPMRFSPYGMWDLSAYSADLAGQPVGRSWEAAGIRASVPFTHVYRDVSSELFNVNGLNHKIVFNVNYTDAFTNFQYYNLPQLDRLNNDATNQALRDIRNYQGFTPLYFQPGGVIGGFNPQAVYNNHGLSLTQSTYFNTPQTMAIRRLLFYRDIDTMNSVNEVQFQINQRLQTRRGFPGNQHIVDWMWLDLYASYFPQPDRDNYGHYWAFVQYNYLWNIGDRTALTSTGWTDPFPGGVRVWTVGGYFNRTDRTNYYLGFRYIDPLQVRAATLSLTYIFSPKYAGTLSTTYDFGTGEAFANSLMFTRMGSDLQVSLGVSYNALQNNFNVLFNIVPNLLPANKMGPMGTGGGGMGVLNTNF